ncbi:MAG: hypothetical protein AB1806_05080 [Acidobacteriota bacterium]
MYSIDRSKDTPEQLGRIGEAKFRQYADVMSIPYLWIDQARETMPAWLRSYGTGDGKRPDAVVGTGEDVLLVEVEYRGHLDAWGGEHFALDKKDAERLAETERLLGTPVVLAYRDSKEQEGDWYGLLLSEALAMGRPKESQFGSYYAIKKDAFESLEAYLDRGSTKARRLF